MDASKCANKDLNILRTAKENVDNQVVDLSSQWAAMRQKLVEVEEQLVKAKNKLADAKASKASSKEELKESKKGAFALKDKYDAFLV